MANFNIGLLSYNDLVEILNQGILTRSDYELINSASIDIRLGDLIMAEYCTVKAEGFSYVPDLRRISLKDKEGINHRKHSLEKDGPYILYPGEFVLAQSYELFHLPATISAEYKLKSSMARIGLEHLNAGWCDAGWHNSVLTLELKNMTRGHEIVLNPMDKIGQVVFFCHEEVPADRSYAVRGRYNNDRTTSGVKQDVRKGIIFGETEEDEAAALYAQEHPNEVVKLEFAEVPRRILVTEEPNEQTGE